MSAFSGCRNGGAATAAARDFIACLLFMVFMVSRAPVPRLLPRQGPDPGGRGDGSFLERDVFERTPKRWDRMPARPSREAADARARDPDDRDRAPDTSREGRAGASVPSGARAPN